MHRMIPTFGRMVILSVGVVLGVSALVMAFQETPSATAPAATKEQEVQIQREALQLRSPQKYQQHLSLSPIQTLQVPAPADGYVHTIAVKLGGKAGKESEIVRLNDSRAALVLKAAKARFQAAQIEKKLAKDPDQQALADARIEAAKNEVDLAQFDADRLVVRAPFNGSVHAVHVVEGQFVRAGQPLLTLVDLSQLSVEVPVDATGTKAGGELELRVSDGTARGKVEVLLPLASKFEPLRDLSDTLQTALVVFDNASSKLAAGQTVYCELIPHDPVVPVATVSVKNQKNGAWKVQVLRNHVVRDIPVRIHSKVGTEKVYISGAFREGDELIAKTSLDLADGTPVRELLGDPSAASPAAAPGVKPKPTAETGF